MVHDDRDAWVLKGGVAVELRRPGLARATRDLDLVLRPGLVADPADATALHEALVEALLGDPDGDTLVFSWRFGVECRLADRRFAVMKLDVVARPEEIGGVELRELPDVLGFAGIPNRSMWVVDMRQQYAEKLHALTRIYATGESTRVRDLLDLVLLIEDGLEPDADLIARVTHVFAVRRVHSVPAELPDPPAAWGESYATLADDIGLTVTSYTDAHAIVAAHWSQARAAKEV